MIIKLDEGALLAAGFSREHVILMRHLVAQIGTLTGQTTLPEVAALADTLTPIVDSLVITVTAVTVDVQDLQIAALEPVPPNNALLRRLDDMQAEFDINRIERSALVQVIEDMKADQERSSVRNEQTRRELDELRANTDQQDLNIADFRRRIAQLEDAQS